MSENNLVDFHSEEANEIMGKVPKWIIRKGMGGIFLIFIVMLIGSYYIQYPQTIVGPITITTANPPVDIIIKTQGRIDSLFVKDGDSVVEGDVIALIYNTSHYASVLEVEHNLTEKSIDYFITNKNSKWIEKEYLLGELQEHYSELKRLYMDYKHYTESDHLSKNRTLLRAQINKNKEYYQKQIDQKKIITEDLVYEKKKFDRDSILFASKVISSLDFERSTQSLIQKKNVSAGYEVTIKNTELSIMQMEQSLVELIIQQENEITLYNLELYKIRQLLLSQINLWKDKYLLFTPISGQISFTKYWSNNQSIQIGQRLASVVPKDSSSVIGKMYIPSIGFGKIAIGQKVNVKLNSYPSMEYGILKGQIKSLSSVPEEGFYGADIIFPFGLQSSYKEKLIMIQRMDGTGEIVTQKSRLFERFILPFKVLFGKISTAQ